MNFKIFYLFSRRYDDNKKGPQADMHQIAVRPTANRGKAYQPKYQPLACLSPVFPLQARLVVTIEVTLEHDQFRVMVEGLPSRNRYAFLFKIT
jgi:hypothetical protein